MAPTPPPPEPPQLLSNTAAMRVKILVIRGGVGVNKADRPSGRTLIKRIEALVSWINAGLACFFIAGLVYRISTLVAPRTLGVVGERTSMKPRS